MKKLLLFAVAMLCLAACDKNNEPKAPARQVTLKASINLNDNGGARKIAPNTPIPTEAAAEVNFHWEEGDKVIIKNASGSSTLTIVENSISGNTADFTGPALSDMSSYDVYYGYASEDITAEQQVTYIENSFRPFIQGTGNSAGFTLDKFLPVLKITIIGGQIKNANLNSINYCVGETPKAKMTLPDGITVTTSNTALIYFPVPQTNSKDENFSLTIYYTEPSPEFEHNPYKTQETAFNLSEHMSKVVNFEAYISLFSCLAAGTRITMADGTTKKVEDIQEGDLVRTFDHEAGKISSAPICLAWKGDHKESPLCMSFASGKTLSIVGTHDLLLENTRKYVRVNEGNVASYVGKRFYNAETGTWDALVSYKMGEPVDFYCPYTKGHINCVAEGMLTLPDDVDYLMNIYELDANLKADAAQLAADIAQYGLFDVVKEWPEQTRYHQLIEDLGSRYYYISIGKGLIPESYLAVDRDYWKDF